MWASSWSPVQHSNHKGKYGNVLWRALKRIKCGCAPKSEVRQGGTPSPGIRLGGDPDSIMKEHPILAAGIL